MIVIWKKDNLKIIPVRPTEADRKKYSGLSGNTSILLNTGSNEVNDDDWAVARGLVKELIEEGTLKEVIPVEEVQGLKGPEVKKLPSTLKNLKAQDAIKIVRECANPKTIEVWLDSEARESVRVAIMKQKEILDSGKEPSKS